MRGHALKTFQSFAIRKLILALIVLGASTPAIAQMSSHGTSCQMSLGQQVSIIEGLYEQLLGVDATDVQISLKEADLFLEPLTDEWSSALAEAFVNALDWSHSRESCWTFSTSEDVVKFADATRNALFNEDSGLSSQPFDGAFMLVVASLKSGDEAVLTANRLEDILTRNDFPGRVMALNSLNGWVSVTAGMYTQQGCKDKIQKLAGRGLIKKDAYCAPVSRFDPMNWTH